MRILRSVLGLLVVTLGLMWLLGGPLWLMLLFTRLWPLGLVGLFLAALLGWLVIWRNEREKWLACPRRPTRLDQPGPAARRLRPDEPGYTVEVPRGGARGGPGHPPEAY